MYGYDDAENRTGSGISYGVGDQVTASNGYDYAYDADGNVVTRRSEGPGAIVTTYRWSPDNRLLSRGPGNSVSFDYDPFG